MSFLNTTEKHYAKLFAEHYKRVCGSKQYPDEQVTKALKEVIEDVAKKDTKFANTVRKIIIKENPDKNYEKTIPVQ